MINLRLLGAISLISIFFCFVLITPNLSFATHTTKGAKFWYNICTNPIIDSQIVEDCSGLVSNHDPYNQGLSTDGWRVAKCVGGGVLLVLAEHPELISAGPYVGCGDTGTANTNLPFNGIDQLGNNENKNNLPDGLAQDSSSSNKKQEQKEPLDSKSFESNDVQATDRKQKESYQLIVYLDGATENNAIGDNFNIVVYNSHNEIILKTKPIIEFKDDHQKISPRDGYPIINDVGQRPSQIKVCAQQTFALDGNSQQHDTCYPIIQNNQGTYWYTIFDYGQIDGFEAN